MNECEFWEFLDKLLEKGRFNQVIGAISGLEPCAAAYLQAHAILPRDYDKLGQKDIVRIGALLFQDASHKTKEAVLMILAHQPSEIALTILSKYCLVSNKGLEYFAEMALEECAMWNTR